VSPPAGLRHRRAPGEIPARGLLAGAAPGGSTGEHRRLSQERSGQAGWGQQDHCRTLVPWALRAARSRTGCSPNRSASAAD